LLARGILDVELVVLAIPLSSVLAEVFMSLGVKNAVSFNFGEFCESDLLIS
jgi:hypothetical protein